MRRISLSVPVAVPSDVMNCVTTVNGFVVSTVRCGPRKDFEPRRKELKSQPSLSHRPELRVAVVLPHCVVPVHAVCCVTLQV
jgi:hypothetical protein